MQCINVHMIICWLHNVMTKFTMDWTVNSIDVDSFTKIIKMFIFYTPCTPILYRLFHWATFCTSRFKYWYTFRIRCIMALMQTFDKPLFPIHFYSLSNYLHFASMMTSTSFASLVCRWSVASHYKSVLKNQFQMASYFI